MWSQWKAHWQIPSAVGFSYISYLQYQRLVHPTDTVKLPIAGNSSLTEAESKLATERQFLALSMFPYRIVSRVWGTVHDITLPIWARAPLYNLWTWKYNCQLHEMKYPLEEYKNLGEFFSRPLKENSRKIMRDAKAVTSPVDGKVMSLGEVQWNNDKMPILEQIKGVRYGMDEFLGSRPDGQFPTPTSKLMYIVLYLAPGDYHRIHSPADWSIAESRHFPGTLFPVNRKSVELIPNLFNLNERVALLGEWKYGFFSLVAVGATNVGSILITLDPALKTNVSGQGKAVGSCFSKRLDREFWSTRGDEVAQFKLGSTVVLVFEAPLDFKFDVTAQDVVQLGKVLGTCTSLNGSSDGKNETTFPRLNSVISRARTKALEERGENPLVQEMTASTQERLVHIVTEEATSLLTTSTGTAISERERMTSCFNGLGPAYMIRPRK